MGYGTKKVNLSIARVTFLHCWFIDAKYLSWCQITLWHQSWIKMCVHLWFDLVYVYVCIYVLYIHRHKRMGYFILMNTMVIILFPLEKPVFDYVEFILVWNLETILIQSRPLQSHWYAETLSGVLYCWLKTFQIQVSLILAVVSSATHQLLAAKLLCRYARSMKWNILYLQVVRWLFLSDSRLFCKCCFKKQNLQRALPIVVLEDILILSSRL